MENSVYHIQKSLEEDHWWYAGRRTIIKKMLDEIAKNHSINYILEIGCGSGGNFSLLKEYGTIHAVEMNKHARKFAVERNLAELVEEGRLPHPISEKINRKYDLILILDVLEHIEEDQESLGALSDLLSDNGILLITTPAYQWLWTVNDEIRHHKRRYTLKQLMNIVHNADFAVEKKGYFNFWLFPIAAITLLFQKFRKRAVKENNKIIGLNRPPKFINALLKFIFKSERFLFGKLPFPWGLSILITAKKTENNRIVNTENNSYG